MLGHVLTIRCAPAVQVFQKMKAELGGPGGFGGIIREMKSQEVESSDTASHMAGFIALIPRLESQLTGPAALGETRLMGA